MKKNVYLIGMMACFASIAYGQEFSVVSSVIKDCDLEECTQVVTYKPSSLVLSNPNDYTLNFNTGPNVSVTVVNGKVTEKVKTLTWKRCPLGQVLTLLNDEATKKCAGQSLLLTYAQSVSKADTASTGWRLPTVEELATYALDSQLSSVTEGLHLAKPMGAFWTKDSYSIEENSMWIVSALRYENIHESALSYNQVLLVK